MSRRKNDRIFKAFDFLSSHEQDGTRFIIQDICDATGWKESTVKSYITKKWIGFVSRDGNYYICDGINHIDKNSFVRLHEQSRYKDDIIPRPRFSSTTDALIDKCCESALLAVHIYNNPTIKFKTPGYIVHMIIAYTAFFHAMFEKKGAIYFYIDKIVENLK